MIGIRKKATHTALKDALRAAGAFARVAAGRAVLAGIGRIDKPEADSSKRGLVDDECSQLRKTPIAVSGSLLLAPSPCPGANAGQVFQLDPASGAFSFGNDLLGNFAEVVGAEKRASL